MQGHYFEFKGVDPEYGTVLGNANKFKTEEEKSGYDQITLNFKENKEMFFPKT